jgi:hypothetical protein
MSDEEVHTEEAPQDGPQHTETRSEEFKVTGDAMIAKVKELLHEGNVRRIIIKNEEARR